MKCLQRVLVLFMAIFVPAAVNVYAGEEAVDMQADGIVQEAVVLEPGGSLRITSTTIISFTPDETGIWALEISDMLPGTSAVVNLFYQGEFIGDVWDYEVQVFILHEGVEIIMTVNFRRGGYGEFSLSAFMFPVMEMQASDVLVVEEENTLISFVPFVTAEWEVEVSIYDVAAHFIELDFAILWLDFSVVGIEYELLAERWWPSDREVTSAAISAVLTEGETYFIVVWNPELERIYLTLRQLP